MFKKNNPPANQSRFCLLLVFFSLIRASQFLEKKNMRENKSPHMVPTDPNGLINAHGLYACHPGEGAANI